MQALMLKGFLNDFDVALVHPTYDPCGMAGLVIRGNRKQDINIMQGWVTWLEE